MPYRSSHKHAQGPASQSPSQTTDWVIRGIGAGICILTSAALIDQYISPSLADTWSTTTDRAQVRCDIPFARVRASAGIRTVEQDPKVASVVMTLKPGTLVKIQHSVRNGDELRWFRIELEDPKSNGGFGWIREDLVAPIKSCEQAS